MSELDRLSTLDPMRDFQPTAERRARATANLDDLLREVAPTASRWLGARWLGALGQEAREREAPAQGFRRPAARRLVFGGVAVTAAAAVAVAAVQLVPGGNGNRAYASWTATPKAVADADVLPQAKQCAAGWGADWKTPPTAADIVLAERRGNATLVLVKKDGTGLTSCFVLDPAEGAGGADLLDTTSPAPAAGRVRTESMGAMEGREGWYSSVIGRAGAGVTGVEIELPDGTEVRASLSDGWWAAWWPGNQGGEADGVRIVVHAGGRSRDSLPSQLQD